MCQDSNAAKLLDKSEIKMEFKRIFSSALFTSAVFFFITGVFFRESFLFSTNGGATTVVLGENSNVPSAYRRNIYSKIRHSIYIAQSNKTKVSHAYRLPGLTKSVHKKGPYSKLGNLKNQLHLLRGHIDNTAKKNIPPVKKPPASASENVENNINKQGAEEMEKGKEDETGKVQEANIVPPSNTTAKHLINGIPF